MSHMQNLIRMAVYIEEYLSEFPPESVADSIFDPFEIGCMDPQNFLDTSIAMPETHARWMQWMEQTFCPDRPD